MAHMTYFVVQSFAAAKRGALVADPPVQAQTADHARRMAERLALSKAGVVAFSRSGDPTTGDYEEAVMLFSFGAVPDEALAAA